MFCSDENSCGDIKTFWKWSLQVFACQTADGPVEIVLAVRRRLIELPIGREGRMSVHEKDGKAILAMGEVFVADVAEFGFRETGHDGFLGWRPHLRGDALSQFRRCGVVVVKLVVVVVRVGKKKVIGAKRASGSIDFGPGKIPSHTFVGRAQIKSSSVGADVRMEQLEKIHERHLRPGPSREWKSIRIVGRVHGQREAVLPQIGNTSRRVGLGFGLRQRWQKHPSQYRNDSNDHQQLDQSERAFAIMVAQAPSSKLRFRDRSRLRTHRWPG